VICHGTLLTNADLEEVEELTRPTAVRAKACYPRSRNVGVANCGVDRDKFAKALMAAADLDYAADTINEEERALALRLSAERYMSDRWNLGDPFSLDDL
jgi:lipoate-protein ligase A